MVTRNVVLTDQQSQFVDRMVSGGTYQNASEVLREGLCRLQREEEVWEKAKAGVLEGLEQVRRGEFAEGTPEEIFARALQRGWQRAEREDH
ncbi:MAG: type II toxin-antitoxin system ParD family antitoxin [Paracoccaceae bacterium]